MLYVNSAPWAKIRLSHIFYVCGVENHVLTVYLLAELGLLARFELAALDDVLHKADVPQQTFCGIRQLHADAEYANHPLIEIKIRVDLNLWVVEVMLIVVQVLKYDGNPAVLLLLVTPRFCKT